MAISTYLAVIAAISAVSALFLRDRSGAGYESEEARDTNEGMALPLSLAGSKPSS